MEAFVVGIYKQAMAIGQVLLQSTPALWDKMGDAAADVAKKMCEVTPCSSEFTKSVEVGGPCARLVCCGSCNSANAAQTSALPLACRPSWAGRGPASLPAQKTWAMISEMPSAACLAEAALCNVILATCADHPRL